MMTDELFTPYMEHLPPGVQECYDEEDEVFALNGKLEDLLKKGWNFKAFCAFVKDRVVFWTPDTSIVSFSDTPSHHEYTIDMIFPPTATTKKKTLHIAGISPEATAPVLTSLLALFLASHHEKEEDLEVIFKAFATNPRKPFGGLDLSQSPFLAKALGNSPTTSGRLSLSFQFMTVSPSQCQALFDATSQGLFCVEFRQCSTGEGLAETLRHCQVGCGPQKLKISCTQQEFGGLASGLRDNSSLKQLELQLHFIFSAEDIQRICSALHCQGMEHLVLEYLDVDDDGWSTVCETLAKHPKLQTVTLAFTDKFADAARRLTPERRQARTEAVLKMVKASSTIQLLQWPDFQRDESFAGEIEQQLKQNKANI